jgi:hypothetical protein
MIALLLPLGIAFGQQSATYRLEEHVFNAGGDPRQGVVLVSPQFQVTLDSIGEAITGATLTSASFRVDGGFMPAYLPPGEVQQLVLGPLHDVLSWRPEPCAGTYDLYAGPISALGGPSGYGGCLIPHIPGTSATDPFTPSAGSGRQYLVTVENPLGEEGTMGRDSAGHPRSNDSPCP